MVVKTLSFGDSIASLIIPPEAGTPFAPCTLKMEAPSGVKVEVPYLRYQAGEQFDAVAEWFNSRKPTENLQLVTGDGAISLFENRWSGHSEKSGGRSFSVGTIRPTEIVLGERTADPSEPLTFTGMRSYVDGLSEWTRFESVQSNNKSNERGLIQSVNFEIKSRQAIRWRQGDAAMALTTDWATDREDSPESPWRFFDWTVLESRFEGPRPIEDHLAEQWKVVNLLTLVAGHAMRFRRHKISDESFPEHFGNDTHYPFVELISRRTVRDYAEPHPEKKDFHGLLFHVQQIGAEGLERWDAEYKKWQRTILPVASMFKRASNFAEDRILSCTMALEAAGYVIGKRDGEKTATGHRGGGRPSTALCVYRVLDVLKLGWGTRVSSSAGLAHAVGNVYNDIKHYREEFPEREQLIIVNEVVEMLARLWAVHLVDPSGVLLREYREAGAMWRIQELMTTYELRISETGEFEPEPYVEPDPIPGLSLR